MVYLLNEQGIYGYDEEANRLNEQTHSELNLMLMARVEPAIERGGDNRMVTSMKREDDGRRWRR